MSDFEDILISEVHKRPCLWNTSLKEYKDNQKKKNCWDEIGEELDKNWEDCKKKWNCLRDQFVRIKGKKKEHSGAAAKSVSCAWKHYTQMEFLSDHVLPRSTHGNYSQNPESRSGDSDEPNLDESDSSMASVTPRTTGKKRQFDQLEHELRNKLREAEQEEEDEDTLFGKSIGKSLKKYPTGIKAKLRVELMDCLRRADEALETREILQQQQRSCSSPQLQYSSGICYPQNALPQSLLQTGSSYDVYGGYASSPSPTTGIDCGITNVKDKVLLNL